MTKRMWVVVAVAVLTVGGIGVSIHAQPPAGAGPFGPINAVLEQILGIVSGTAADVQDVQATLDDPETGLQEIKAEVRGIEEDVQAIEEMVLGTTRLVLVKSTFSTSPDDVTLKNLDVVGGLPFGQIRRYTVTVNPGQLTSATPGTATLEVMSGVAHGTDALVLGTRIFVQDISTMSPLPNAGGSFPPFAGTNTFLRVTRSGDGLGPVDVTVNAFIETAQ